MTSAPGCSGAKDSPREVPRALRLHQRVSSGSISAGSRSDEVAHTRGHDLTAASEQYLTDATGLLGRLEGSVDILGDDDIRACVLIFGCALPYARGGHMPSVHDAKLDVPEYEGGVTERHAD